MSAKKLGYFGMAVPLALAVTNACDSSPAPDGSSGGSTATGGQSSGGASSGGASSGGASTGGAIGTGGDVCIPGAYSYCEYGGMGGMGAEGGLGGAVP